MPSTDALQKLLSQDLTTWTGVPATCTLASLVRVEVEIRRARATSYAEPLTVWLRDHTMDRISVRRPDLPEVPELICALGRRRPSGTTPYQKQTG